MGIGWRKALCTTIHTSSESSSLEGPRPSHRPKTESKFSFFRKTRSSPSTPRTQQQTQSQPSTPAPRIRTGGSPASFSNGGRDQAEAATPRGLLRSLKLPFVSPRPPSPRSPSGLALLLGNNFRSTRNKCGICLQSVKAANGTAIFTAECSHSFHLHCISADSHRQLDSCPACASPWRRAPLRSSALSEGKQQEGPGHLQGERLSVTFPQRKPCTVAVRVMYDDDEPLTGNARTRFHPIPESEDENCEGGEQPRKDLRIVAGPDAAPLSTGRICENHVVLLRVKSPAPTVDPLAMPLLDPSLRAPIDLVVVLDDGAKLQTLRRAMRLLLSCLGPRDRLSIIGTAGPTNGSKRLLPLRRMSADGQRWARRVVERHWAEGECCQSAVAQDGLQKATKVLEDRRQSNPAAAILHLGVDPEGQGLQPRPAFLGGRYVFVEVPHSRGADELHHSKFARLVGGRLSVVCHAVQLELSLPCGEIRAVYCGSRHVAAADAGVFRMGDMHASQEKELLVEVKLHSAASALRPLVARCSYRDPVTHKLVRGDEHSLPVFFSRGRDSVEAPKVLMLRCAFVAARAVSESRHLADVGDFATGFHLLVSARRLLLQSRPICPSENLRAIDRELEEIRRHMTISPENVNGASAEVLTPMSAWRAAERLANVAITRKSLNRERALHGFENARF